VPKKQLTPWPFFFLQAWADIQRVSAANEAVMAKAQQVRKSATEYVQKVRGITQR
jgi:hypothetical protein